MHNELTNLLPLERQRAFSRDYIFRLVTVVALMLTALIGAAAVLLLPSYVFLVNDEYTKKNRLATIEATIPSADEKNLLKRLSALSVNTATLTALGNSPSVSRIVREMLAIPRPGIILSSFSYASAVEKKSGTLVVSGTAATRDSLQRYQTALQNASFIRSADLPVSAYAKDSQISFAITITLTP
ncbi:MAG: hypothetical protein Q8P17_02450 [bacterium]|nr:hypothetical protein [bacterium]